MTENVIQGERILPFVLSLLYVTNFDRMKSNYDKSYLNRPTALYLSAPVWKLYLRLRDLNSSMFMLCLRVQS
jgi:hypothetical protein